MATKDKQKEVEISNGASSKSSKTIVLSINETDYEAFVSDKKLGRVLIEKQIALHPELFPSEVAETGFIFKGFDRRSKKQNIKLRRISIGGTIYRIRPSFMMPYMRGKVSDLEGPLLLIRFGVPFWVISQIFGRNSMYWYRLYISLSMFNLVGTTVYNLNKMPNDILADEFHTKIKGVKAYIATIISEGCFLCVQASFQASEAALKTAYGIFKQEVQTLIKDYQPITVNTDGWQATQNALKSLFNKTVIVECYLHAVIKIRDRATKKLQDKYQIVVDKLWNIYRADTKRQMSQQIRRLREWAIKKLTDCPMQQNILKLCKKKALWLAHFDAPTAFRTSAHLDRIMKNMERHAINAQMFRASVLPLDKTSKNFRAYALIFNFAPFCPKTSKKYGDLNSPVARLNEFVYHQNWLENLNIAASLNGFRY